LFRGTAVSVPVRFSAVSAVSAPSPPDPSVGIVPRSFSDLPLAPLVSFWARLLARAFLALLVLSSSSVVVSLLFNLLFFCLFLSFSYWR
jgi:hypothetical protein